jgi:YVTN family beta-propeller protein
MLRRRSLLPKRFFGRLLAAGLALTAVATAGAAELTSGSASQDIFGTSEITHKATNQGILVSTNQWVNPLGRRLTPNVSEEVSASAINPNGQTMAVTGYGLVVAPHLTIVNLTTGKVIQRVSGQLSAPSHAPLLYSADGKTLWVSQPTGVIRFAVNADGTVNPTPVATITIPGPQAMGGPCTSIVGCSDDPLATGMALTPDGSQLYVALNANNTLGVINTANNQLTSQIPVGNAPNQVVLYNGRAFVTNEGGRKAQTGDYTDESDGTPIVANPVTATPTTGTVSVVSRAQAQVVDTISVGLEPTAEYLTSDGTLIVANSNDDSISLIDPLRDQVTQTVSTNPVPGASVGSAPNSITMSDPTHLLVSVGRDNAIAVYRYGGARVPLSFEGLLPTDMYPLQVQADPQLSKIVVANERGDGSSGPPVPDGGWGPGTKNVSGPSVLSWPGTLTVFTMPPDSSIPIITQRVFANNDWQHLLQAPPKHHGTRQPVPARLGEPSPIKHVFLIIKENKTYDQLFGDIPKGNGDPSLTQFGQKYTPNLHAIAEQFGLFDNFYDPSLRSVDGHSWLMQGDANDYNEHVFEASRSYPFNAGDPLVYQRDGFLWNAAEKANKTVENFGEYVPSFTTQTGQQTSQVTTWQQWYKDSQILEGKASGPLPIPENEFQARADIPSLATVTDPEYPPFDQLIPDQYRVDVWLQSFQQSIKSGKLANLNIFTLGDDHTGGGPAYGTPYPYAEIVDNDLATGRLVQAITKSKFWRSSAIFVVEDDAANGVDHLDGHRSILLLISPYAKRGVVLDHYYTQLNVVKTIEQILGMSPMNQEDLAAEPMFDAFTTKPNLTPYTAVPSNFPLGAGLPTATVASAASVASVPSAMRAVAEQWIQWGKRQDFKYPDLVNPEQLDRFDYYTASNWRRPYPGDSKILTPAQVPGAGIPAAWLAG